MVGHDDVGANVVAFAAQHVEEVINAGIAIGLLNERQPAVAGEGDEVNAFFGDGRMVNGHAPS